MGREMLTRRSFIQVGAACAAAGVTSASVKSSEMRAKQAGTREVVVWTPGSRTPRLSPAARRAVNVALGYGDRYQEKSTGLIQSDEALTVDGRSSFFFAVACLMDGSPERKAHADRILSQIGSASAGTAMLLLKEGRPLFEHGTVAALEREIRTGTCGGYEDKEDIIAGRNINIPLSTWARRIAVAHVVGDKEGLESGAVALRKLTDLIEAHGSSPEFNSPTYEPLTLLYLRSVSLTGEPSVGMYSLPLEKYLWESMAWRWHPRLKQLCGPWARAYQDSLVGGSGIVPMLADIAWGAFYDESVAYPYEHAHDHLFGAILPFLVQSLPFDVSHIALQKRLPLTVTSAAEQVTVRMGEESKLTWVPGGIAELTTWMDENLAVGSATRSHLHAMQNSTYVAQWTRTGKPVEKLSDLGQAYTRFVQNGQRPGKELHSYRNYRGGHTMQVGAKLWADGGRPFALQSGSTALVLYVPRGRERWFVERLEAFMAFPRLDTVDEVLVDGVPVDEYEGAPDQSVVIRSGNAAMGLRFAACDAELTTPRLVVERSRDHVFVGLRLVSYEQERELSALQYRRYAATIGAELRYAPTAEDLERLVRDMKESRVEDEWEMAIHGGHREVAFQVGSKRLYGRFEPISESWLRTLLPEPAGKTFRLTYDPDIYRS